MAQFKGSPRNDRLVGADNQADDFLFRAADLAGVDIVDGGAGPVEDRLIITSAGPVTANTLAGVSEIEAFRFAVAGVSLALDNAVLSANGIAGRLTVFGSQGADAVNGSALGQSFGLTFFAGSGVDRFLGGAGQDSVLISYADLNSSDSLKGGAGADELTLLTAGTLSSAKLAGVGGFESFSLRTAGTVLTIDDAVVVANGAGGRLTVVGSAGADVIRASALTGDFSISYVARSGNDDFTGGAGDDQVMLRAPDLGSGDTLRGGTGLDELVLTGPGSVTPSSLGGVSGFERIRIDTGGTSLTLNNAVLTANGDVGALTIQGSAGVDEVNAALLTGSNRVVFAAGAGNDSFVGGAGNDRIGGGAGNDAIKGGGGVDTATFDGSVDSYTLTRLADGRLRVDGGAGDRDILATDVERLVFSDGSFDRRQAPAAPRILAITADTGASASDFITADRTLVFSGTADADVSVEVFLNGISIGTVQSSAAGAWSLDHRATALVDGRYRLAAEATNAVLETSSPQPARTLVVDTAAPVQPSIDLRSASDTGLSQIDDLTSDQTPTLVGSAEAGARVRIFEGGTPLGTRIANGSGQWSFTTEALSDGAHSFTAVCIDAAGNESAASETLALTVDTLAPATVPVITGFSDDTGETGDGITADNTVTLFGTAEPGIRVAVRAGAGILGTATTDGTGAWSFTTAALGGGVLTFKASAMDAAGNEGAASAALAVRVLPLEYGGNLFIQGDATGDRAGSSVASAGDVNGDGFDDLIIGARYSDDGGGNSGEAYVIFGKAGGPGTIDLTTLSPSQGFIIRGDSQADLAGFSVASAGDVNGDGLDDVIVGAPQGGYHSIHDGAGEAYVVFGKAGNHGMIDLTNLTASQGFTIRGSAGDLAGRSVASAGDVNGDGYDDLIVGAPEYNYGGPSVGFQGGAFVVFGKPGTFGTVDLTSLSGSDGFMILTDAGEGTGASVASAGDVNGDGFDDVIVGAPYADDGGAKAGTAYVVFGQAGEHGTVDLTTLSPSQGFIIQGDMALDQAGVSVASAGDVNGDGFDDVIVGAPAGDDGGSLAGEAYVVFGKAGDHGTVDLTSLSASQGFIIQGDAAGDQAGCSVASAGDVNGDGFDDLVVGALRGDNAGRDAGEAYVIFGDAGGRGTIDLTTLSASQGFIMKGITAGDEAGRSVASAGDVNRDGFDDLIIGAHRAGDNRFAESGEAIVFFGRAFDGGTTPVTTTGTASAEMLIGGLGNDTLSGGGGADSFSAGAGNDLLSAPDLAFRFIDGGSGTDRLIFTGTGQTIDFSSFANNKVAGIEGLDVRGTGNDTVVIGALDVFDFSDTPHIAFTGADSRNNLVVQGDARDAVELNGLSAGGDELPYSWQLVSSDVSLDGSAGGAFDFYNLVQNSNVLASVAVDSDMLIV